MALGVVEEVTERKMGELGTCIGRRHGAVCMGINLHVGIKRGVRARHALKVCKQAEVVMMRAAVHEQNLQKKKRTERKVGKLQQDKACHGKRL